MDKHWAALMKVKGSVKGNKARSTTHLRGLTAKVTEDDVRLARTLWSRGVDQPTIGKRLGISQPAVSRIVHRKSWAHVCQ
jgi:DNA-directed RNA polymerase specialized sigma subunit